MQNDRYRTSLDDGVTFYIVVTAQAIFRFFGDMKRFFPGGVTCD